MSRSALHVAIIKAKIKARRADNVRRYVPSPYSRVVEFDDGVLNRAAAFFGIEPIPEEQRKLT